MVNQSPQTSKHIFLNIEQKQRQAVFQRPYFQQNATRSLMKKRTWRRVMIIRPCRHPAFLLCLDEIDHIKDFILNNK